MHRTQGRLSRLRATIAFAIGISAASTQLTAQQPDAQWLGRESLPLWVVNALSSQLTDTTYSLALRLNPFFQLADFDGDGRLDAAVLVRNSATGKEGLFLIRRASPTPVLVGAGTRFGTAGDDFVWMDVWHVERDGARDVLEVEKSESAGGTIRWNGRRFVMISGSD